MPSGPSDPNGYSDAWDAALAARGVESVRIFLATSAGPGPTAILVGLAKNATGNPTRSYAERWLKGQDAIQQQAERAAQARRDEHVAQRLWLAIFAAGFGTVAIVIAALEGWPPFWLRP